MRVVSVGQRVNQTVGWGKMTLPEFFRQIMESGWVRTWSGLEKAVSFFCEAIFTRLLNIICLIGNRDRSYDLTIPDKGKPVVRRGRKASDLCPGYVRTFSMAGVKMAGLPTGYICTGRQPSDNRRALKTPR